MSTSFHKFHIARENCYGLENIKGFKDIQRFPLQSPVSPNNVEVVETVDILEGLSLLGWLRVCMSP